MSLSVRLLNSAVRAPAYHHSIAPPLPKFCFDRKQEAVDGLCAPEDRENPSENVNLKLGGAFRIPSVVRLTKTRV